MLPLAQHRCQLRVNGDESSAEAGPSQSRGAEAAGRRRRGRIDWEPVSDALLESCGMLRPLTERGQWIRRMSLPIAQPSPDVVKPLPFTLKDLELFEVGGFRPACEAVQFSTAGLSYCSTLALCVICRIVR
jgi:hypothetical protein